MADGTQVGSLYYDFDIDDSKVDPKLDGTDKKVSDFSDRLHDGLNKAAAGFAIVGAGLLAYEKSAVSYTTQLYSSSKALGTQIGVTTTEASRLVAAFGRMGIDAQSASQMFGIFSKQITASTESSKDNQLAAQKLQLQITDTKNAIAATTDEIKKNGDASGTLGQKLAELNNKLATQQNQLSKNTDAFAKLGISTVDANGKQKDFETLLFEVADKFQTMPDGIDKSTIAMQLFGRSGKDMIKVLNTGSAGIKDLEDQADKLGLTLNANTIDKISKLVQSQKDLKQQTDALKIAVGTETAPVLTSFDQTMNGILNTLLNTSGPLHDIVVGFLAFGGPVASGLAAFLGVVGNLGSALPVFADLAKGLKAATIATTDFTISLVTNPIFLLVLAIAVLGFAIYEAVKHFQQLGDIVNKITDWFSHGWGLAVAIAIAAIFPFIGIPLLIISNWTTLQTFFTNLWNDIKNAAQDVINWVSQNWPQLVGLFLGPFAQIWAAIIQNFNSITDFISGIPGKIEGFFSGAGSWLYNAGRDIVNGLVNGIKDAIGAAVNAAKSVASSVVDAARNILKWHSPSKVFIEAGQSIGQGLVEGMKSMASPVARAASSLSGAVIAPAMSKINPAASSAAGGGAGTTNKFGDQVFNIGQINNKQDEDWVIRRQNRNAQLVSMGGAPLGAQA